MSLTLLRTIGWLSVVIAVAALGVIVVASRRGRQAHAGASVPATLLLVAAPALLAAGWRVATAAGDGANIGGGLAELAAPIGIAVLLVLAVLAQSQYRPMRRQRAVVLLAAAALTAPLLWGVDYAVISYDRSRGTISQKAYDSVVSGSDQASVRDRLGQPGEKIDWFFAAQPAGSNCDYYTESKSSRVFRFCYRNASLVTKQSSDRPH